MDLDFLDMLDVVEDTVTPSLSISPSLPLSLSPSHSNFVSLTSSQIKQNGRKENSDEVENEVENEMNGDGGWDDENKVEKEGENKKILSIPRCSLGNLSPPPPTTGTYRRP